MPGRLHVRPRGRKARRTRTASRRGSPTAPPRLASPPASPARTLSLIDEPTLDLHTADVEQLLACFDSLLAVGHSLIVVDHDLHLIKAADWLIDLGPEAAAAGGRVVATGTPEDIARAGGSITGQWLREVLPA